MMDKRKKKMLSIVALLLACILFLPVQAFADGTVTPVTGISVTASSASSGPTEGSTVTITRKGGTINSSTCNITITNTGGKTANVSFTYAHSGSGSATLNGATISSGTYSGTLDANGTVTMTLLGAGGWKTGTLTLSNFSWTEVAADAAATVTYDSTKGSVSLGGSAVASGGSATATGGQLAAVATPASGCSFIGWVNTDTHEILSSATSTTLNVPQNMNVRAVFINNTSDTAWFNVDNKYLTTNLTTASSLGTKIVLANNGALSGTHTIASGDTLLIPCDSANTVYTTKPGNDGNDTYASRSVYRKLSMAAGSSITVEGAISIGGKAGTHMVTDKTSVPFYTNGAPCGPLGYIDMASTSSITVKSGGNLYAWGFITGSGSVTVKAGGSVYEDLQIRDYRGGDGTNALVGSPNKGTYKVFPFSQYYIQNIEVPLTLEAGATENVCMTVSVTVAGVQQSTSVYVGNDSSGGLIRLSEGSITKTYNGSTDRIVYDLDGTISFANLNVTIRVAFLSSAISIDSKDYVMHITNNMTLNVNDDSKVTLNQDMALLPGAVVNIEKDATVTLGTGNSLFIYDRDSWSASYVGIRNILFSAVYYAPGMSYTRTDADIIDAEIILNGTLDATNGYVYTTAGGANVHSTGNGKLIGGAVDTTKKTYQVIQSGTDIQSYPEIAITPAQLMHSDGTYLATADSGTTPNTYTYTDGKWICQTHTGVATDHTCDVCGFVTECADTNPVDHNCDVCKEKISDCEDKNSDSLCDVCGASLCAHANTEPIAAVDPTCTKTGLTEGLKCSDCDKILTEQEEVPTIDHTWVDADCDTPKTCSECGTTEGNPAGHSYDAGTVTKNPTCLEKGVMTYECTKCDYSYTADVAATGHTGGDAATCNDAQTCTVCGEVVTAALGHNKVVDAAVAPSCTETGLSEGSHCERCGEVFVTQEPVSATGHDHEAVVTAPTCTEEGYTTYTCSACGDTYTGNTVAATGHSYNPVVTNPTCTEQGYTTYTCACGESYVDDYVATIDHSYTAEVIAPTCTEQGYTKHTCSCGNTYNDTFVAATGHSWNGGKQTTAPGCESEGVKTFTCTVDGCGETKTETIAATGHSWNQGEVTTAPGCESAGVKTFTCSECSKTRTEAIDATGHTPEDVDYVAPNCTEIGREAGVQCTVCKTVISGMDEIPATGHDHEAVVTKPTCEDQGYTTYTCTCGDNYVSDYVDASGHSYETSVTAPTCTEAGYTTYTCHCGDTYTGDTVEATGHSYESVVTKSTCDEQGYTTYTCHCGDSYVDNYTDPTGHSYTNYTSDGNATCTADGTKTAVCNNGCGESNTVPDTGSATGHTYIQNKASDVLYKEATCTTAAIYYAACDVCGAASEQLTVTVGDPLDHVYVDHEGKAPTCTDVGWNAYQTCDRAGCTYSTYAEIPAQGHTNGTPVVENNVDPTCTVDGSYDTVIYCSVESCGVEVSRETTVVPATGHTEAEAVVENEVDATCTAEGSYDTVVYCSVCDAELSRKTVTTDKVAHTEGEVVVENETAATCGNAGSCDNVVYCTECGAELSRDTVELPATGNHSYTGSVTTPATCGSAGVKTYTCVCGDSYTERIPATGAHNYNEMVAAPTCTEEGYTTYTCSICGNSYVGNYVNASGHSWKTATYTAPKTCSVCGATEGEPLITVEKPESVTNEQIETAAGAIANSTNAIQPEDFGIGTGNNQSVVESAMNEMQIQDSNVTYETTLEIKLNAVTVDESSIVTKITYDVTPMLYAWDAEGNVVDSADLNSFNEAITFRLPVAQNTTAGYARVWHTHNGQTIDMGLHEIIPDGDHKYVEVKSKEFSEFEVETIEACETHIGGIATCQKQAVCTVCGESYGEFGEHTYTDGICTVCADQKVDILINFVNINVALDSEIILQLKFKLPEAFLNDKNAKVVITKDSAFDGIVTTEYSAAQIKEMGADSSGRYVFEQGMASGEMTKYVTAQFYDGNGNLLNIHDYSDNSVNTAIVRNVVDYARRVFSYGNARQKKIIAAMLTYGGYAQQYFNVDAANPAYNILPEYGIDIPDISSITADSIEDCKQITGALTTINQTTQNVGLNSSIYMDIHFVLDAGENINDYTFVLTTVDVNMNQTTITVVPTFNQSKNRYEVRVFDVPAAFLDHMYKVEVTNVVTGETYAVQTSATVWLKSLLLNSTKQTQINLGKAMYYYNQCANEFFGK